MGEFSELGSYKGSTAIERETYFYPMLDQGLDIVERLFAKTTS